MMNSVKQGCTSPEKAAGSHLSTLISRSTGPVLVLFSGGSALSVVDSIDPVNFGPRLTFGVVDERATVDSEGRNLSQLLDQNCVRLAVEKGVSILDAGSGEGDVSKLETAMEDGLRSWRESHPDGTVVVLLGVGADGHTAGIFPDSNPDRFQERFKNSSWVVGYDAGKEPYPLRVTTTATFLRNEVDHAVVFARGEEKRNALERVIATDGDLPDTPARIIRELRGSTLFTDLILE